MNTRPHQQSSQGNAAPTAEHRPPGRTTQTWDQCRHDTHAAVLPEVFHSAATRVPEANAGLFQHARTVGTAGGRP
jgi:hypothetical protein